MDNVILKCFAVKNKHKVPQKNRGLKADGLGLYF